MMNKMKKGTAEGTMLLQQLMHSVFFHSFVKEIYVHRVSVCVCVHSVFGCIMLLMMKIVTMVRSDRSLMREIQNRISASRY